MDDDDDDDGMKNFLVPSTNCRLLFFAEFFLRLEDAKKKGLNHQHDILSIFDFADGRDAPLKRSVSEVVAYYCCNYKT